MLPPPISARRCGYPDGRRPVLLWSRHPEIDLGEGLSELLAGVGPCRLADLPQAVLRFRRYRRPRGRRLADHLTLLHDDADRIPDPGSLLQTPA